MIFKLDMKKSKFKDLIIILFVALFLCFLSVESYHISHYSAEADCLLCSIILSTCAFFILLLCLLLVATLTYKKRGLFSFKLYLKTKSLINESVRINS